MQAFACLEWSVVYAPYMAVLLPVGVLVARVIVSVMCVAVLAPGECARGGEGE